MAEITHEKAEDGRDGWEENEESNFPKPALRDYCDLPGLSGDTNGKHER